MKKMLRKVNNDRRIFLLIFILRGLDIEHQYIKNPSTGYIEIPIDVIKKCFAKLMMIDTFFIIIMK